MQDRHLAIIIHFYLEQFLIGTIYAYIEDINELDLTQFRYCLMKLLTDCR